MNQARNNDSNFLPGIPDNISDSAKIKLLYRYLEQAWQKVTELTGDVERLKRVVNSDVTTKRIVEMIGELKE